MTTYKTTNKHCRFNFGVLSRDGIHKSKSDSKQTITVFEFGVKIAFWAFTLQASGGNNMFRVVVVIMM